MSTVQSQIEKKFEIHVKEHAGKLLQHINSAWKERRLCDFFIKVGSKEIPVHKIVLSEGSDYFKAMFSHKMKEVESGVAVMEGVDPECMLICIEYIYTGKVSVPESKVQPLLQVAGMLQLTRLCEVISAFLETNLDPDSFFLTRKIANTFNLQRLKDHVGKYALENFKLIAVKEEFKDLETEFVKFLIESKGTKASAADKCKTLVFWANSYRENRSKVFEDIFQNLKLEKISAGYRLYLSDEEPLVSESARCLRQLFKSSNDIGNAKKKDHKVEGDRENNVIAVLDKKSKSIQAFNPEDKTWTKVQALDGNIADKRFVSATVDDENLFILAGDKTNYRLNYVDPDAEWIQLPNRAATDRVVAVCLHSQIYAFQDNDPSNECLTIEKLGTNETSWSRMRKPFPCYHASLIATGGDIYTFGGYERISLNRVAKFDPNTKTWSNLPAMPTARYGAGSSEINGKIYVIGGTGNGRTTECFNIESKTWTILNSMSHQHFCFNACSLNGKIYAVGGSHSQNSIEEYDPDKNTWETIDMMTGKTIHDLATITRRL